MAQTVQRKTWIFVINNPTEEDGLDPHLCDYLIVAQEVGEDGTPHLQCFAHLKVKVRFNTFKNYVPRAHIEAAHGSDWQNRVYCCKGEQPKAEWDELKSKGPNYGLNAVFEEYGDHIPTAPKEKDTTYAEALDAPTVQEGLSIVKAKRPRDYCLNGEAIERNLKNNKKACYVAKYKPEDFNRGLLSLEKSTLICGATKMGKTHFACAHFKNPLVVSNFEKIKKLTPDNDGIIFDDMSFRHWPPETVIHLLDQDFERQFKVLYGTTTIPANTPKIFTNNLHNPFYKDCETELSQIDAIEGRLNRVIVLGKLY